MRLRRWIAVVPVCAAIVATVVLTGAWLHRLIRQIFDAEERLHATILVCRLISDHLQRNGYAEWPHSWQELGDLPPREWGPFAWPRDESRIETLVVIDFNARLDDIANQDEAIFTAIRPNGPAASTYLDVGVGPLLSDIREHASGAVGDNRK
jgi:hypothetical protein